MKISYNRSVVAALIEKGYHNRHIAIIVGCHEKHVHVIKKQLDMVEPTLKFLTQEQKQRMYVLNKFLNRELKSNKWGSNEYYYLTILKFLLVPKTELYKMYPNAPQKQKAAALKERSPIFLKFDYTTLGLTSEEYINFVSQCYTIINDIEKAR